MSNNSGKTFVTIKSVFEQLLCFFTSLFLFALMTAGVIWYYGANRDLVFDNLSGTSYYTDLYSDIVDQVENALIPTGLSSGCLEDVFTRSKVYVDAKLYLDAAFEHKSAEIDTKELLDQFEKNVLAELEHENIIPTEEVLGTLKETKQTIDSIYRNGIRFPNITFIVSIRDLIEKFTGILLIVTAVFTILGCVGLFLIHRSRRRMGQQFSTVMISAGLMLSVMPGLLLWKKFYTKLQIYPVYFHDFIVNYLERILRSMLYIGMVWIILGLLLVALRSLGRDAKSGMRHS